MWRTGAARITRSLQACRPGLRRLSGCGMTDCELGACADAKSSFVASAAAATTNIPAGRNPNRAATADTATLSNSVPSFPSLSSDLPIPPHASAQLSYLSSLLACRKPGYSMPAPLYVDPLVHEADLALLWRRGWLFAGFSCQIPRAGDYFTYEVGDDSIIIMRDGATGGAGSASNATAAEDQTANGAAAQAGVARAFFNSCRHRGSRIVDPTETTQHIAKRLVCPYHQWSYGRDGSLVHAREMGASFDKSANGLIQCHLEEVAGLIFICLTHRDQKPMWDFGPARQLIAPQLEPHGLARHAKIAHTSHYSIRSNWKLVYENNRECYHCAVSHPEYVKSNYDLHLIYKQNEDGSMERDLDPLFPGKERILDKINARTREWERLGFKCSPDSSFPGDGWYRASRMPLRDGWVTESLDGQPVSRVMGSLPQRDMGSLRIHTLPNFWIHLSGDHGVSARLTPTGPLTTSVRVDWLVHADAVEGVDYSLSSLLPLWSRTSEQDWRLCEINMAGVQSSAYTPGVLSERKETGLDRFCSWYVRTMQRAVKQVQQRIAEQEGTGAARQTDADLKQI